jgi:LDH2 family malate/lactate/ureidoglycolate dehydrogenase
MIRIAPERLARLAEDALLGAGTTRGQASAAVRAMMHASLHGVDSHGIRLLGFYVDGLLSGHLKKDPQVTIARPRKAAVFIDADGGLGHFATYLAMEEACATASELGIGMAAVKNSTHFGAAGAYTLCAAEAGFIGFLTCNSGAVVAPHSGQRAFHGTNPISLAAPLRGKNPFLLDMATSSISWNKLLQHRARSQELPDGTALDQSGTYTRDPAKAAVLAALGGEQFGYKGAGLAGMAEVLAAMLTGMNLSFEEGGEKPGPSRLGHFIFAIDPGIFVNREVFEERLRSYLEAIARNSHDGKAVYAAGDPQWLARADRLKHGIPLDAQLQEELKAAAAKTGVPLDL